MAVREVVNWGADPDNQTSDLDGFPDAFPARHTPARIREVLASIARWIKDVGGGLETAGDGSAYTLATTAEEANYVQGPPDGSLYRARIHADIKKPATLKVRTAPARALYWPDGTRPKAGSLVSGVSCLFLYRASDTRFLIVAPNKPTITQSDWDVTDADAPNFIKNKPTIPDAVTIPHPDWSVTDVDDANYIRNKPIIPDAVTIPNSFEDVTRLFLG